MTTPYWSDFIPNSTFYRILSVACREGTFTPPDTWSSPTLGFANVLLLRQLTLDHTLYHQFMTLSLIWLPTKFYSFPWFDTTNLWPFSWFDFLLNLTLLNIAFHWTSATVVACRHRTLTPPDTWSRPFGTCICSTCWDQFFSELVVILPDYALRISLGTFSILLIQWSQGPLTCQFSQVLWIF